ncbi:MAG: bifunctional acetate--CoA ligase family protein/GNAT family N-acetyltransferase, partial [Bdellovibrionales bacterium]
DQVYDTAFRRAGLLRVYELEELFDAAETLSKISVPKGERLAILTNGGGAGVLATDSLIEQGGILATLSPKTIKELNGFLPSTWSGANPVDIIGDASAERYTKTLKVLLGDEGVDAVLTLNCPTAVVNSSEVAKSLIEVERPESKSVLAVWLGGENQQKARDVFAKAGMPCYSTPGSGVRAFMHLVHFKRGQEALMATPQSIAESIQPNFSKVKEILDGVSGKREWLSEYEAKQVLSAYEIPTTRTWLASSADEAARLAKAAGGPVALKIFSPDIIHKSDVGGVVLNLKTPEEVKAAALAMMERIRSKQPTARLEGFIIEDMIHRPGSFELIVGMNEDIQFGPVILFGEGGTAVEVIADTALELPPLNLKLANDLISRTRVYRRLKGYRDQVPVNLDALRLTLVKVSQLIVDFGEIVEIDINPLIADAQGVMALDARIRLKPSAAPAQQRLAIKPYPKELEMEVALVDGRKFLLRPIRAEDEPALVRAFGRLTPKEVRQRFNISSAVMNHMIAARFTQINYDREMALILMDQQAPGEIQGIAGLSTDPDNVKAEYAVIVQSELAGQGAGRLLMDKLIVYARSRGIKELFANVLSENSPMLKLCTDLGFSTQNDRKTPGVINTWLKL